MKSVIVLLAITGGGLLMWAAFTGVSLPWYGAPITQQAAAGAFNVAPPLHWNGFQQTSKS